MIYDLFFFQCIMRIAVFFRLTRYICMIELNMSAFQTRSICTAGGPSFGPASLPTFDQLMVVCDCGEMSHLYHLYNEQLEAYHYVLVVLSSSA